MCTTPSGFALTLDGEEFEAPKEQASWFQRQRVDLLLGMYGIGHVREYPMMHCFGIPRTTQLMIQYIILTECFREFQYNIALWECC